MGDTSKETTYLANSSHQIIYNNTKLTQPPLPSPASHDLRISTASRSSQKWSITPQLKLGSLHFVLSNSPHWEGALGIPAA